MKSIVITGATSGIGYAAARALTLGGCVVIGIGHDEERCSRAQENIMAESPKGRFSASPRILFSSAKCSASRKSFRVT
jgi:NAD(P)-dependent dehydrogenase (short-subunit alcohol dehydrogenase family)